MKNADTAMDNDSEDDDVLNIGLEESFGYDYEEEQLQENPAPPSPAIDRREELSKIALQKDCRQVASSTNLRMNPPVTAVVPRNSNLPLTPVVTNFSPNHGNLKIPDSQI